MTTNSEEFGFQDPECDIDMKTNGEDCSNYTTFCEKFRNIKCCGSIRKYMRVSTNPKPRRVFSKKRKAEPEEGDIVKIRKIQKTVNVNTRDVVKNEGFTKNFNANSSSNVIDAMLNNLKRRYIDDVERHFQNVWNSQFASSNSSAFADQTVPVVEIQENHDQQYQNMQLDDNLLVNAEQNNLIQEWMKEVSQAEAVSLPLIQSENLASAESDRKYNIDAADSEIANHIFNMQAQAQRPSVIVSAHTNSFVGYTTDVDNHLSVLNENFVNDYAVSEAWSDIPSAGDLDVFQNISDVEENFEASGSNNNTVSVHHMIDNENNYIDSEEQFVIVEFNDDDLDKVQYEGINFDNNNEENDDNMVH